MEEFQLINPEEIIRVRNLHFLLPNEVMGLGKDQQN